VGPRWDVDGLAALAIVLLAAVLIAVAINDIV
jgi:hypothetical protein